MGTSGVLVLNTEAMKVGWCILAENAQLYPCNPSMALAQLGSRCTTPNALAFGRESHIENNGQLDEAVSQAGKHKSTYPAVFPNFFDNGVIEVYSSALRVRLQTPEVTPG